MGKSGLGKCLFYLRKNRGGHATPTIDFALSHSDIYGSFVATPIRFRSLSIIFCPIVSQGQVAATLRPDPFLVSFFRALAVIQIWGVKMFDCVRRGITDNPGDGFCKTILTDS